MGIRWAWAYLLGRFRLGPICLLGSSLGSFAFLSLGLGLFLLGLSLNLGLFSSGLGPDHFFGLVFHHELKLGWIGENLTTKIQSNYNRHNFVVMT